MSAIRILLVIIGSILLLLASGCKSLFESSPYAAGLPEGYQTLTTAVNKQRLEAAPYHSGEAFKIAVLSDTHYYFGDLRDAIDVINARKDIDFVVLAGDFCDQGLMKEFMLFYDELARLHPPVFTVIGNHDYLAAGEDVYAEMFGPFNYTLDYRGYRFIFFDAVFWEKNGRPDFDWLTQQLRQATEHGIPILISHIPPFGDQYNEASRQEHLAIARKYQIALSIHGHIHEHSYSSYFNDGTDYLVAPSTDKRMICILEFRNKKISLTTQRY